MLRKIITKALLCAALLQTSEAQNLQSKNLNFAVEYTSHATSFYYADAKKMFDKEGIKVNNIAVYVSGAAVATAFVKEDFDAAYMCLVPAIITYANGQVPIKIIAGTHLNGYGIVANSKKIKSLKDLEKDGVKIGVGPKGTVTSFIQELIIEKAHLNPGKARKNFVKMNSSKQIMALKAGLVDAIVVPEHFVSLAASMGDDFKILAKSDALWKDMPGSVIVVSEKLLKEHPEIVSKIRKINKEAISKINQNKTEASIILSKVLNVYQDRIKNETKTNNVDLTVTPKIAKNSLENLKLTDKLTVKAVQEVINKMFKYGFIQKSFDAKEILVLGK